MHNNYDEAEKIINATDIVALVSKYVKLEKQGKNYKGLCPFHNEDTPSFVVSPDKNIAHCFGCNGGGNPVNFLMQIENIDFSEAVRRLAEFNGMEYQGKAKEKKIDPNQKYYKIMEVAEGFYQANLEGSKEGINAKKYLYDRGLSDSDIKEFGIGLAPEIGDSLYQVLKESDFLELDIADVSLVDKNLNGYHDIFAERIMFPIYDMEGRPIAFSARIYNTKDKNQPKYINSRESKIFHKGETLYNFHLAKPYMLKKKRVILHEGQMDVIATYRAGLKEVVCTMGVGINDYLVKTLKKFAQSVVICYDSDRAGVEASKKAIKLFKNHGFQIHLVLMEGAKDPDEYVKKYGKEAYIEFFENHQMDSNQYLYETSIKGKNLGDQNVIAEVKNEVFALIQQMASETEKEDYLKRFAGALNTSFDSLKQDFESYRDNHAIPQTIDMYPEPAAPLPGDEYYSFYPPEVKEPVKVKDRWNSICEIRLFQYAKSSKELALEINSKIDSFLMNAFSPSSQRLWFKLIDQFYVNFSTFDEGLYMKMLEDEDTTYYFDIIEALHGDSTNYNQEDLNLCIEKLRQIGLDQEQKKIQERIVQSTDPAEQSRLIDEIWKKKRTKETLKNRRK